jgi:hypothetical protein
MSTRMLEQLTHNAVLMRRFKDAGYYYWLMPRRPRIACQRTLGRSSRTRTRRSSRGSTSSRTDRRFTTPTTTCSAPWRSRSALASPRRS